MKLQHQSGSQAETGWKGAPVLAFDQPAVPAESIRPPLHAVARPGAHATTATLRSAQTPSPQAVEITSAQHAVADANALRTPRGTTMNPLIQSRLRYAASLALALLAATTIANASPASDEQSLQRGASEDVTAQQKYRSAIREAGGAYKESLRECAQESAVESRSACVRAAKDTYDRDMADARRILKP